MNCLHISLIVSEYLSMNFSLYNALYRGNFGTTYNTEGLNQFRKCCVGGEKWYTHPCGRKNLTLHSMEASFSPLTFILTFTIFIPHFWLGLGMTNGVQPELLCSSRFLANPPYQAHSKPLLRSKLAS